MKTSFPASFPKWSEFEQFDKDIRKIGFIKINKCKSPGKETGYYFLFDILDDKKRVIKRRKIVIWTTALEYSKTFRDPGKDAGRVLTIDVILDSDGREEKEVIAYGANHFVRVGNFFSRLFKYGDIQKERIMNAPFCPHDDCRAPMDIVRKRNTRQYHWVCKSNTKHVEHVYEPFDVNLKADSKSYLAIRRKKRANDKKRSDRK